MAKAGVFARQLRVFADRTLSPAAQSAALARVARRERDALIAAGRAAPSYRTFVDGREGAAEETVGPAPAGRIVYRFNDLGAVTMFALSFLRARSPAPSGRPASPAHGKHGAYRDTFYVGIDGRFVMARDFDPAAIPPGAEVVIGNINAYSRKVDVQLVGGRKLTFSVAPGLFEDAADAVNRRYGVLVTAKRVYTMRHPFQWRLRQEQTHKSGPRAGRSRKRMGQLVESPALVINAR